MPSISIFTCALYASTFYMHKWVITTYPFPISNVQSVSEYTCALYPYALYTHMWFSTYPFPISTHRLHSTYLLEGVGELGFR